MALQRVPLNNFRGGLNTRDSPFELQPNESPDLLNVTISALVGQLESRKGKERYDKSGLPSEEVDFAKQVVIGNGKRFLMLSINGGVWQCSPTGEVKKLFAGTAGSIWDFEVFADAAGKDWVYMGNGVDAMQKWNGEAAATVAWPATKGEIPKGGALCVWEDRMFITFVTAAAQRVYFSEFSDPEATIKEYGFVDVRGPEEDLDAVQDIAVLGARLIVLKRRGVFFISSAVTMLNRRVGGPGVWGRFQVAELEDKLYFFNPQGIFSTSGVGVTMESGSINNYFPTNLNTAALEKARIAVTRDTYPRLLLAVATGVSTINDKLVEMVPHINFRRIGGRRYLLLPAFFLHTLPCSAIATWNPTGNKESVVGTSNAVPGLTEFPVIETTESFEESGEEHPMAKANFELLAWAVSKGEMTTYQGIPKFPAHKVWQNESGTLVGVRYKGAAELLNPSARIQIYRQDEGVGTGNIAIWACLAPAVHSGYAARFTAEGAQKYKLEIERWVVGVKTVLATFSGLELKTNFTAGNTAQIGIKVTEGKVRVFVKHESVTQLVLVGEAADATFTKGYSGIEFAGGSWELQQFATAETPTHVSRISTLFTGSTDEGGTFEAYWHSAWLAIQEQEPKERVRRLNVQLTGDVIVEVFKDFEPAPAFTAKLPFKEGSEEANQYRFARVRPETFGRYHSVRFRNVPGSEPFLINSAEVVVRGGKEY